MLKIRHLRYALLLTIAACAPVGNTTQVARLPASPVVLPTMKTPPGKAAPVSNRNNATVARDFLQLAFFLESGRELPVLSRFEGPISLRITGNSVGAVTERDLDQLLSRLRNEADIPISLVNADQPANITVEFLKQKRLRRAVPQAACFVAPGVESWSDFLNGRNDRGRNWTSLTTRTRMAIFIPSDVSPQEIRDCLHEEIAQALGPVNDLYRLTDSIFNDDNFQIVLTGFDMLILRAYYDNALKSGMTQGEVAARLPLILNRIHPQGRGGAADLATATPQRWKMEIESALGSRGTGPSQLTAARRAVSIAREQGWNDNRLGFSLYAQGRLALAQNSNLALNSFAEADAIFRANPETRLHAAHLSVQSAAFALSAGRPKVAIRIVDDNSAVALRAENATLLATLLMIKAAALEASGKSAQGDIVRLDSLAWARYGLGNTSDIRARLGEIAALAPTKNEAPNQ